jgi:hypothetical protein
MTSPLGTVYEKYKHLDGCLSDPEWCTSGEGAAIYAIAGELWRAVKEAREQQQEITSSADIIADLERSLEFYKARMNNLQCWQSSMRDPERKIVCDILANGVTLTTKEEIDNAGNPCEENGCTDIENCDEICQHSRVYSPVQMQQAITQAMKKAREDFANQLKTNANCMREMKDRAQCGHCPYRKCKDNGYYDCDIDKALRGATGSQHPEPKGSEPE